MTDDMKNYPLNTETSFTKEACDLFHAVVKNQKEIINKHNEIEIILKKNTELFSNSKTLSEYITVTHQK